MQWKLALLELANHAYSQEIILCTTGAQFQKIGLRPGTWFYKVILGTWKYIHWISRTYNHASSISLRNKQNKYTFNVIFLLFTLFIVKRHELAIIDLALYKHILFAIHVGLFCLGSFAMFPPCVLSQTFGLHVLLNLWSTSLTFHSRSPWFPWSFIQ